MGSIFEAHCLCGYGSGELLEGCGMAGPQSCRDLARCDHCKEIVSIRANSGRPRCPQCRHKVSVLHLGEAGAGGSSAEGPMALECPRCHRSTMRLAEAGLWD
jgi:DNA-directed RNA polymerase subunit RPC12/RpoP